MDLDDYLTTSEAAAIKGLSVETLTRLIRKGELPATKKGGTWLIHRSHLEDLEHAEHPTESIPLAEKAFVLVHEQPIPVIKQHTQLGRDLTNDIVINEPSVSRFHAEIHYSESRFMIRDLGSSGGTFVNNHRVSESPLFAGDTVRLASAHLIFMTESASLKKPAEDQTLLIRRPKLDEHQGDTTSE